MKFSTVEFGSVTCCKWTCKNAGYARNTTRKTTTRNTSLIFLLLLYPPPCSLLSLSLTHLPVSLLHPPVPLFWSLRQLIRRDSLRFSRYWLVGALWLGFEGGRMKGGSFSSSPRSSLKGSFDFFWGISCCCYFGYLFGRSGLYLELLDCWLLSFWGFFSDSSLNTPRKSLAPLVGFLLVEFVYRWICFVFFSHFLNATWVSLIQCITIRHSYCTLIFQMLHRFFSLRELLGIIVRFSRFIRILSNVAERFFKVAEIGQLTDSLKVSTCFVWTASRYCCHEMIEMDSFVDTGQYSFSFVQPRIRHNKNLQIGLKQKWDHPPLLPPLLPPLPPFLDHPVPLLLSAIVKYGP